MDDINLVKNLVEIFGSDFLLMDRDEIEKYSRSTLPRSTEPRAVVMPKTREEVVKLVKFANERKIGLYPISRGKNWGYGSACAAINDEVIVDLSGMNSIKEVNTELGYAVIEPGVTQEQLHGYLKKINAGFILDCTGSGPDASVVGNTVDRGFGHTAYGDHFLNTCGMEVVLGDGRLLKTGYGHYSTSAVTNVYKWGIGPFLEGLFSQSNYGIVTEIGLWLMPKPETTAMFFCSVDKDMDLSLIIDSLRPLKLSGRIKSLVHIGNDLRVISSFKRYPFEETGNKTPISDIIRRKYRKKGGFGAWNVSGAIYGTIGEVSLLKKDIKKALKGLGRVRFIDEKGVKIAKKVSALLDKYGILQEQNIKLKSLDKVFGLLNGVPTEAFLYGTLWRVRELTTEDISNPLNNNVGLLWVSPILPMTGKAAQDLVKIINPVFREFGFEPLITVSLITERAMVSVTTIAYDKSIPEEVKKAEQCYNKLYNLIFEKGYIPYRTNIFSMDKLSKNSEVFWDVADNIKSVLDPENIISRGRYQPNFFKKNKD